MANSLTDSRLRILAKTKYISEIAREYGLKENNLRYRARILGIKSEKKFGEWNVEYSLSIRRRAIAIYRKHTARETAQILGLTHGQIIGILETSRRKGLLAQTFKDQRTKTPWSTKDWLYTIQRCGIRPRSFIGKKLGRGSARVIKERLRVCNSGSKWLNGMPKKWASELWGADNIPEGFKTDAGPTGGSRGNFQFVIIPWTDCEFLSRKLRTPSHIKSAIRAMAKFQKWIHGVDSASAMRNRIRRIQNER